MELEKETKKRADEIDKLVRKNGTELENIFVRDDLSLEIDSLEKYLEKLGVSKKTNKAIKSQSY